METAMKSQTILRFALLGALLGTSAVVSVPAFAQKDARRTGSAKEDRNQQSSKNNKESRGGSGTNKSEGRGDSGKSRKDRR
jgi:hypothetical protein